MQFSLHAPAQIGGSVEVQRILLHGFFQTLHVVPFGGTRGAFVKMFLEFKNSGGVQFSVGVGVNKKSGLLAIHRGPPGLNSPARLFCNCFRARARRDMTVPMGTSDRSAISL